ncbi:hypothetical protein OPT61_g1375 [Boeremia exigua]|uniref:Uncharacterized protein n=1 Tax=Boeremia exigua TaxID=749465 RepID=A0ACC2IQN2_9PLEO|nr:hypothetical protein OPT61_g1375 [Boeremia exigua]
MASKETRTSLAALWEQAFTNYNQTVEKEGNKRNLRLRLDGFKVGGLVRSIDDVKNAVDDSSKAFQKYRHSGSTIEKVREFIGNSLSFISFIGDNVVSSASTAFPPAGAIWTVTAFAIKACQAQSEDYDQLLALISETSNFLKTIKIIEANVPDCKGYTEFVTEALTAIIGVFAVQTKLMLMKRPLVFLHTLVRGGGDGDLAAAYARVTEALNRLSRANEMMAIKNTEDIKILVNQLGGSINFYHENIMAMLADQAKGIEMSHKAIIVNQVGIEANQQGIEANHQLLSHMLRLMQSERLEKPNQSKTLLESAIDASIPINRIDAYFHIDVDPELMRQNLARSHIPNSVAWLFETQRYQDWLTSNKPFLTFASEEGQGKSHVAYAVLQQLEGYQEPDSGTAVAYFCFEPEAGTYPTLMNALCSILIQISKQDHRFRSRLAKGIPTDDQQDWTQFTVPEFWALFRFDKYYREEGDSKLYIILDNADFCLEDVQVFLAKIATAAQKGSRLKVFLTFSTDMEAEMHINADPVLKMSHEDFKHTKAAVLEAHLEAMPRLSRFQTAAKRRISEALLDDKFSIMCAVQFLEFLEMKGLERPALKELQTIPASLDEVYDQTISRCLDGRAGQSAEAMSYVLQWVTVAQWALSLQELYALLQLQFGRRVLDLEEEVSNQCATILEITNAKKTEDHARKRQKSMLEMQLTSTKISDESSCFDPANKKASPSPARVARNIPAVQPLYSDDDSDFMVHFKSAAITRYMEGPDNGFNEKSFRAHLAAFTTCIKVLQAPTDSINAATPEKVFHNYAARTWVLHLYNLHQCEIQSDCATDADVETVVETLLELYNNGKVVAENLFEQKSTCYDLFLEIQGVDIVEYWFSRHDTAYSDDSTHARHAALVQVLAQNPRQLLTPLVKLHAEIWVKQATEGPGFQAFLRAYEAHLTTKTYDENEDPVPGIPDVSQMVEFVNYLQTGIIPQDYRFFRAVAILWNGLNEEEEEPWNSISKSLELFKLDLSVPPEHHGVEEFFTVYWAGVVFDGLNNGAYNQYLRQAAQIDRPESIDERAATQDILVRMLAQVARHEKDRGPALHLLERLASSPDPDGTWLPLYIAHLQGQDMHKEVMEAVNRYGSLRLAMSPDPDMHSDYQKSAKTAGLVNEMLATYHDLVSQLEPLGWASPTRFHLALVYRRIVKNELAAKELLYQVIDASGCFDPAVLHENEDIPLKAQMELSEIIYNQFLASSVPKDKRTLLREMESLTNRRLGQARTVDSSHGTYSTSLARMYQKLGPIENFFETLNADFEECMDKLNDKDPCNDANTLRQLCKILACVPGLEKEAGLALSASFCKIDPALNEEIPSERASFFGGETDSEASDSDADDDFHEIGSSESKSESGLTDGDGSESANVAETPEAHAPDIHLECAGCGLDDWSDESWSLFRCMICTETTLCKSCVDSLDGSSAYCGDNHSHIKAPVEGWIGIKNGEFHIENNEPFSCQDWIAQLRELNSERSFDLEGKILAGEDASTPYRPWPVGVPVVTQVDTVYSSLKRPGSNPSELHSVTANLAQLFPALTTIPTSNTLFPTPATKISPVCRARPTPTMSVLASISISLLAALHVYIMSLEMFFWTSPAGLRAFALKPDFAAKTKTMAANQGLYNGFLAAGLLWSLVHPSAEFASQIAQFFTACVLVAGIYGGFTANTKIFFVQGLPAALCLAAILFT